MHYRKRGERFTQTYAIGKDATVITFEFVYNADRPVFLEVVKLVPDKTVFESRCLIRHIIFVQIAKEFSENVVKNDVVNEFRRIFFIARRYVIDYGICNIFQMVIAVPQTIKFGYEKLALFGYIGFHNADKFAVISFIAKVCRGKSVHGSIVDVRTLRRNVYHRLSSDRFF